MSSSEPDFDILFVLFSIGRVDFDIFGFDKLVKKVWRFGCGIVQGDFHVVVELSSEGITIVNVEDSFKEVDIDSDVEIFPCVIIRKLADNLGDFLSFQEHALGNTGVLNFGLGNIDCLISQVIVNEDFPDAIVLPLAFDDMLLEECIESQDFPIILEPRRLYTGDVVVFGLFAILHEGEIGDTFGEFIDKVFIDLLFNI